MEYLGWDTPYDIFGIGTEVGYFALIIPGFITNPQPLITHLDMEYLGWDTLYDIFDIGTEIDYLLSHYSRFHNKPTAIDNST